ncbi:MAG: hypothetical protein Q4G69_04175 [Planctomycetia bacterium]|nr:hypothetical protein [Planctomycetia bacterium]
MTAFGEKNSFGREKTSPLRVILCGDVCRNEFREIRNDLEVLKKEYSFDLQSVPASKLSEMDHFDLIFFLEDCPGRFSQKEIAYLRSKMDLAIFVFICGPLCEGGGRTAENFPGTARFYWYHWKSVLCAEFLRFIKTVQEKKRVPNANALFHLQGMNSFEDYCSFSDHSDSGSLSSIFEKTDSLEQKEIIVIADADRSFGTMLLDFARHKGRSGKILSFSQISSLEDSFAATVLIDTCDIRDPLFRKEIIDFAARCRRSSLFLFAFAPDISDYEYYASSENIQILSKPFYY